jgi:hypothetical protein
MQLALKKLKYEQDTIRMIELQRKVDVVCQILYEGQHKAFRARKADSVLLEQIHHREKEVINMQVQKDIKAKYDQKIKDILKVEEPMIESTIAPMT